MKKFLKNIIPDSMLSHYRAFQLDKKRKSELDELYQFDRDRYIKSSYEFVKKMDFDNLRAKITFHYHSIEKGLSNPKFREGFGVYAFTQLFFAMDKYLEGGYPTNDSRFQEAISTVESYISKHDTLNFPIPEVKTKFEEYKNFAINEYANAGGSTIIKNEDLVDYPNANFKTLALNRYSIRDFGKESVETSDILEAVKISTKTPSVCNRQSTRVYYVKNEELLNNIFHLQGGLTTHGENLQGMLLVTADRKYMNGPHERNQTYIDGGMFLMSLVYSLTSKNIATCVLNADFSLEKEKKTRESLNISDSEDLIAFVAVGSFPETVRYANSPRENAEDILIIK